MLPLSFAKNQTMHKLIKFPPTVTDKQIHGAIQCVLVYQYPKAINFYRIYFCELR